MDLHEYQAKAILEEYGIPLQKPHMVFKRSDIPHVLRLFEGKPIVAKVQVHAGGRGKAGGVKVVKEESEKKAIIEKLLDFRIVTKQTGVDGLPSKGVLVTEACQIAHEYYLAVLIDRKQACPILIASKEGGMDIEELAHKKPEAILKIPFSFTGQLHPFQLRRLKSFMGWHEPYFQAALDLAKNLAKAFIEIDASMIEINPLVLTKDQQILALDAKISLDDNALFRHIDYQGFFDPTQMPPSEVEARDNDLSYVALKGTIGCMVNGAGLAMATMDIIDHYGGKPANFLDVGGSATKEKVAQGFKIILSDPSVNTILINIFGGIMNCATIAEGVIHAAKELDLKIPLVVRLEGTNVEEGKKLIGQSALRIISAQDLEDAAKKAVEASSGYFDQ
jgi:succinyl-CoA synthetase beta subunit